ncbi:MAG TPA: DMT family transporter [Mycobacteriales bacterium]|nr:DMT family transporter [Mycobacteriales bacterium]
MSRASAVRLVVLAALWGSSFLWIKIALEGMSPIQLVLVRLALGAAVVLVLARLRGLRLPRGRAVWSRLLVAATLANALPFWLFAVGERTVDSAVAGVLNGTTPLWTVLVALAARTEARLSPRRLGGLAVGFAGTLVIFEPWDAGTPIASWGGLACLLAAMCYGVSFVFMGRTLANRGIAPLALSAGQLVAATMVTAAVTPFAGLQPLHLRAGAVAAVAVLGALGTGVAYVLNYRLITDEGATATSTVTYLIPVAAVLLGAVVLAEPITVNVALGMVLVLAGVALAQRRRPAGVSGRRQPSVSGPPAPVDHAGHPGHAGRR